MKGLGRFFVILGGAVGCTAAAGAITIGCGSSSQSAPPEEAGVDGTFEDVGTDAPADVVLVQPDTSTDGPGGQADSTVDAQSDATVDSQSDAALDSAVDGQSDAQADVGPLDAGSDAIDGGVDSGGPEAGPDASPIFAFPGQVAAAVCGQLAACCFGQDASAFNMPACLAGLTPFGYSGTLFGSAGQLDSGALAFNPAKAQACLSDIASIDCSANVLTEQVQVGALADCVAALYGTLAIGAPCSVAIECAPGEFCDLPTDGGAGACAALRGDGGSCDFGTNTYASSEEACSFRRTGSGGLRCNNADLVTGNPFPISTWTCTPQADAGVPCNFNQDCRTQLCDPGPNNNLYVCATSMPYVYPYQCGTYVNDAGGAD